MLQCFDVLKIWVGLPDRFTADDLPVNGRTELIQKLSWHFELIEKVDTVKVHRGSRKYAGNRINVYCKRMNLNYASLLKKYFNFTSKVKVT